MSGRVLVIDDSPDDRFMAAREIGRELPELQIEEIGDAAGIDRGLGATDLIAVVTDYQLRWTDGLEVLRRFKAQRPEVPVVMFTNSGSEEVAVEAMKAGLDDYVIKSVRNYRRLAFTLRGTIDRAAERRARKSVEKRIQRLFQGVPVGLFVATSEGVILEANAALARLTGHADLKSLQGMRVGELLDEEECAAVALTIDAGRDLERVECSVRRPDGTRRYVEVSATRALAEGGQPVRYEGFVHDISDRKQAEQAERARAAELAAEARRKDEFLATLAHELRNPLSAISAAAAVLGHSNDGASRTRALGAIERQMRRITRIVDDLLDLARVTEGKIDLRIERVDLAALARHALEGCEQNIAARRHALSVAIPEGPVWVRVDAVRIEQVLVNLLENAAKYTPPGGRIEVALEVGEVATLRVRDNGIGIPADLLPHVFDLFVQGERPIDRGQGGLGIGLTLVRRLVDMHSGQVEARSAGTGHGSEFFVRLPLAERAAAPHPAELAKTPAPAPARWSLRILVIEDNDDFSELLEGLLDLWGHSVQRAKDGGTGLALAQQGRFDLAIVDIGLPVLDGFEVARRLRAMGATLKLVALSGYGQRSDIEQALEAGFDAHLTKPITAETLEATLRRIGGG